MIVTDDNKLINNDEVAASLVDAGGESIPRHTCETYIEKHGGQLRCYHLFTTVFPKSENILSEDQSVRSALFAVYSKTTDAKCKSLSIPALKYSPKAIKKMITHMTDQCRSKVVKTGGGGGDGFPS